MRDCKHCGVKITVGRFNAIYCSASCQKVEQSKRLKKPPCLICGGVLDRKSGKYCSSNCYGIALSQEARSENWPSCSICGIELERREYTTCSAECLKEHKNRVFKQSHPEIAISTLSSDQIYYLMGLIWTDGCLIRNKREDRESIHIGLKDKEHIEKIGKLLNISSIRYQKIKEKYDFYSLNIKHPDNVQFYKNYGLVSAKSLILKMPFDPLTEEIENVCSFLRGVFDGDGSISIEPKRQYRIISICSGSKEFIEGINICLSRIGIEANIKEEQRKNILYYVSFSARDKIDKFYRQCYTPDCLSLDRKRDKFIVE